MNLLRCLSRLPDELNPLRPVTSCISSCATAVASIVVARERTKQTRTIVNGLILFGFMLMVGL